MDININPYSQTVVKNIIRVEMEIQRLILGKSVTVRVLSYTDSGELAKVDMVEIAGEEYQSWGSDDDYIINLTLSKLGYTRQ